MFIIRPGQPIVTIANNLKEANLISNALAFRLLVAQMGIGKNIQAGDFRLSANMSSKEIASLLTHGAIDIWITFREGLRKEEIAQLIETKLKVGENENYIFDKSEFIELAEEGYMFPDTYLIPRDSNAADIANRLMQTFSEKVNEKILANGQKFNLSNDEVVTLASLIEREAKTSEERPVVAGILINRLNLGMPLQVDATVQYAKGYDASENSWWPQITQEDYKLVKSAYNTYLHGGLPPGPIASPGLESIRAAAEPTDTDHLYYLHDIDGKIHYAKTAEEHQQNIHEFL